VENPVAAVVLAKGVDLSGVALKVADLVRVVKAGRVVKVVRAKTAVKAAKFTTGNLHL
jgi:hypothetical protein